MSTSPQKKAFGPWTTYYVKVRTVTLSSQPTIFFILLSNGIYGLILFLKFVILTFFLIHIILFKFPPIFS